MNDADMTDEEWLDFCERPGSFVWALLFWAFIAFMCLCTLTVVVGGTCYLAGYFS